MKEIPLTQGQVAIVDDEDWPALGKHKWCADRDRRYGTFCARARINGHMLLMHRFILDTEPCDIVDHVNHNRLDNRRHNLRNCTHGQNNANSRKSGDKSSLFKGICWDRHHTKWRAEIKCNEHRYFLGYFADEQAAALAYDRKARELFGQFALTNFAEGQDGSG